MDPQLAMVRILAFTPSEMRSFEQGVALSDLCLQKITQAVEWRTDGGGGSNDICPTVSWEANGIILARDDGGLYKIKWRWQDEIGYWLYFGTERSFGDQPILTFIDGETES